jgi:transcriptional repressor NrdR
MICPYCKFQNLRVVDKRDSSELAIRRRRECEKCGKRFTTYERVETVLLNVLKRDGKVEEFDREKLKRGIMKAMSKRHIPESQIDEIIADIEHNLMNCDKQIIRSVDIGEMVLKKLTTIDKLGALLFAAVYKEFQSLEDVQNELERLSKKVKSEKLEVLSVTKELKD